MSTTNTGFIENKGQIVDDQGNDRSDILFTFRSPGATVFIGKKGLHYLFFKADSTEKQQSDPYINHQPLSDTNSLKYSTYRLDVKLVGSKPNPEIVTEKATGYYENYYLPHCPEGITFARGFEKITLKDVYPGIDWVFYQYGGFIKYDFIVQPGADPSLIKLKLEGATELKLQEDGSLFINTPLGSITEHAPVSFEGNDKKSVLSTFRLNDATLSFSVDYDKSKVLTIDPILKWATYYGSINGSSSRGITTDNAQNVYLCGLVYGTSQNFSSNGHQNVNNGSSDAFLVKFNSGGVRLWATYFGGNRAESGKACVSDSERNVFLVGLTQSSGSVAFSGHQMTIGDTTQGDAFIAKFDSNGVRRWSTYFGGSSMDYAISCSIDKSNNLYVAGNTSSTSGVAIGGHQLNHQGITDAFLSKFSKTGNFIWSTYYGGAGMDYGNGCTTDSSGNVFLMGTSNSNSSISHMGHQNSLAGDFDAYLVKFDSLGSRIWATYHGGINSETIFPQAQPVIACDKNDDIYISATTNSTSGISSNGFKLAISGISDNFLTKFSGTGALLWSTYYGGPDVEAGATCVAHDDNVYLCGFTSSSSGISFNGFKNDFSGIFDSYIVKFSSAGKRLWATYYGGTDYDMVSSCAVDGLGSIYLSGNTLSSSGITHKGHKMYKANNNLYDPYLAKFDGCSGSGQDTIETCKSFYWSQNGKTYTKSGTYTDTTTNLAGCDSIIRLVLAINHIRDTSFVEACNYFTWPTNNNTYTSSGIYVDTLTNAVGCDSILQLNLTINKPQEVAQNISACDHYTWPVSGKTYNTNSIDTAFLQTTKGCDSILILNLTIHKTSIGYLTDSVCKTFTSPSGKFTWTKSGTYTDTITNSKGCDSIITINLHVKEVDTGVVRVDSALIAEAQNASYHWLNCQNSYSEMEGEKNAQLQPLFNGSYAVAITQNGCTDTSACYTITGKESIDNPFGTSMAIFPNPTTGVLYVRFGEPVEGVHIAIWNSAGKLLSTQNFDTTDRFALNILWADGVYYLKISGAFGKSIIVKVVKI